MSIPAQLRYTEEHEWVKEGEGSLSVGVTDYAQQELGDVVFVELPEVGTEVKKGSSLITVESVKAVSDVYAPLSGKVVAVNESLNDSPELINSSPYEDGWIVTLEVSDISEIEELMDDAAYAKHIAEISK